MEIQNKIEIYQSENKQTEIAVHFDEETVWLDAHVIAQLFDVQRPAVVKHINNIFKSGELQKALTCSILEQVAADGKNRKMKFYNLDVIISVGYRVNSTKATQFRQWATQRLKDYLVKGYAINEKRLEQKQQEVLHLKTGIQILSRAIEAPRCRTNPFVWQYSQLPHETPVRRSQSFRVAILTSYTTKENQLKYFLLLNNEP